MSMDIEKRRAFSLLQPLEEEEEELYNPHLHRALMLGLAIIRTLLLVIITGVLLLGCAIKPSPEQLALYADRDYPISSPEEVLDAAQNVLRLADGEDVVFIRPAAQGSIALMEARRSWLYTTLIVSQWGTDRYSFIAEPLPPVGTRLTIVGTRDWSGYITSGSDPINSPALLDLIHSRISYFLGEEEVWRTCSAQGELGLPGDLNPLCDFTADDGEPPI